jgi:hypothetical protein
VVLFQILSRILQQQSLNGSFGPLGNCEETSFAIIALSHAASLPLGTSLSPQLEAAIQTGREYLRFNYPSNDRNAAANDSVWTETIPFKVENICESYILAALNTPFPHCVLKPRIAQLGDASSKKLEKSSKFYAQLPMFKGIDDWRIKAWIIEGYLFLPILRSRWLDVFGKTCMKAEKYFEYYSFGWTSSNYLANNRMGPQGLADMMLTVILIYQVDEYFEDALARGYDSSKFKVLTSSIEDMFAKPKVHRNGENGHSETRLDPAIYQQLVKYLRYVLSFPKIQNASRNDKTQLEYALKAYLLANTQQLEDNYHITIRGTTKVFPSPPVPFFKWVSSTASEHVSGHYLFAFLTCVLSNGEDFLVNSQIKYIAQDCMRRSSIMCRMLNDSGSLQRDRDECNLNSVFFPEFATENKSDREVRSELVSLAKYEKRCVVLSFGELEKVCGSQFRHVYEGTRLLCTFLDFFGEIYELKDIGIQIEK